MELLLPAGDLQKAYTAFRYGADAIYCGCSMFSLRTKENTFTEDDMAEIIPYAQKQGKKVYVTVNAFPHQTMMRLFVDHLQFLERVKPDGIIFADFGVLKLAKEHAPSIDKHLSVQTSTVNAPALEFWRELGVSRVILAREMSLKEVAKVHEWIPDMELEIFIHGAVCMAYSGRCLLSTFNSGRDANRGICNHSCRWNYQVYDEQGRKVDVSDHCSKTREDSVFALNKKNSIASPDESNFNEEKTRSIRDFEKSAFIEEEARKGEIIPVEEDFHGTHIMSSRDMCMIEYLADIAKTGVVSLKVEGRNKTAYYLATVARAYRRALDDLKAGKDFDPGLWKEIQATANRGFFPGFLNGKPREGDIQYEGNRSTSEKEFCGLVTGWKDGRVEIEVKNRIETGAMLEFVLPRMEDDFSIEAAGMRFGEEEVDTLHGGNTNKVASIKCEKEVPAGTFVRQEVKNPSFKKSEE